MRETQSDTKLAHGGRSDIRVPVIAVVGLILSITAILFGQIVAIEKDVNRRFDQHRQTCLNRYAETEKRLDKLDHNKAERSEVSDRYTGKHADERKEAVDQRIDDVKETHRITYEALLRDIQHNREMIRQAQQREP